MLSSVTYIRSVDIPINQELPAFCGGHLCVCGPRVGEAEEAVCRPGIEEVVGPEVWPEQVSSGSVCLRLKEECWVFERHIVRIQNQDFLERGEIQHL